MVVTWGPETVHTFGSSNPASTPAATTFGTPAPAPSGGLFGSAPGSAPSTSLFGSPAPSSGGTSLFGTPSSGSLFGSSPAPASGSSLFGSSSTSTSLFGASGPSTNLFGSSAPASSAFGSASPFGVSTSQQQQQIPAQAALQAHMDASARQEAERVRSALEQILSAYRGTTDPASGGDESNFVAIVYNDLTPEQRQLQWLHGIGNGGQILEPDRPLQVSGKQWKKAVVNNPDPQNYMPVALVGAVALQARVSWQQDRAKELASNASTLRRSHETIRERSAQAKQSVIEMARRHDALRKRLLDVMLRVELARCMNLQIQPDEFKALQRLTTLNKDVDYARGILITLQDKARTQTGIGAKRVESGIPERSQLLSALKEQRLNLETLISLAQRDDRDVGLIQKRVTASQPAYTSK